MVQFALETIGSNSLIHDETQLQFCEAWTQDPYAICPLYAVFATKAAVKSL